ncbi:hypothetical protein QAD02_020709 [Eretmocerus hayati]|uniref:Uncharacterized protein n=1 Tax=Eretmocerus hayati TaxID=131215 RepID=A0ACC2PPH5_9HYME|nr:hypothetical protein QAD02_020709 [Eretmocerus hayati]
MSPSGPCNYKLKLHGRGRASDALIQHRITAIGYEIYNCAGNSRLMRNKVPALQALRRKFLDALRNRSTTSSDESGSSDSDDTPTLGELEEKLSNIDQAMVKNRRDRAFCHYQIARLEAEIGALHDAQDYYRVSWFRSTDDEELEVRGYENTLVDEWVYVKLKDLRKQSKDFTEWRDELLYEAPKLRRDYYEVEGALRQELDRLEQLRLASRNQHPAHVIDRRQNHQKSPIPPTPVTKEAEYKFEKLPFGLRQLHAFRLYEETDQNWKRATKECKKNIDDIFTSGYTSDSSSTSSAEEE